jgi:mycobactin peptide synthetase MbtF
VLVNFLGRFHQDAAANALRSDRALLTDASRLPEPNLAVRHELTLMAAVLERDGRPVLGTQWRTLPDILSADDVAILQTSWLDALREVTE